MRIRRAGPDDLAAVVALTGRAYAQYRPLLGHDPIPVTEDYGPRIAAGEVWLLEESGAPVALIVLEEAGETLLIFSVAVVPERQGDGLGRRLLAFAEAEARERGFHALRLYTNARMTRNIDIYRRSGFTETERESDPRRPDRVRVYMQKPLAPAASRRTA